MIYKNQVKEKRAFKDAYRIMKKIGAFLLSLVMLLSVIVLPTNTTQAAEAMPTVSYSVHAQGYGWMNPAQNGKTAGTTGQGKRLEAIAISLKQNGTSYAGGLRYQAHVQTYGWMNWVDADTNGASPRSLADKGKYTGTVGKSKRMEAIRMELTGELANRYEVLYRVHMQTYGWGTWTKGGETAGTVGQGKRLEAIEIKLIQKPSVTPTATVNYQVHAQSYGWMNTVTGGTIAGTTGKVKRLEAIKIKLTGEMAEKFDVYYRVHSQTYGWLDWACNGEASGTSGLAKRLEAIEIVLVEKGETAPGETRYPYVDAAIAKQIEKEKEEERKRQEEAEKEANDKATSENLRKVLSEAVLVPTITRDTAIDTKVQEVLAQVVKPEMDNYDKLLACYKWIIDNSFYKYDGFTGSWNNTNVSYSNNRDRQVVSFAKTIICGVNGQRYGTCINYGSAMVVFARALGFEAYRVGGETLRADNSYGEHYWCVIKINGIWYNFDPQNADNNWTDPLRYFGKTNSEWLGIGYKFTHGSEKAEGYIKGGTYK